MSWFRIALPLMLAALAGCGFRPLYAERPEAVDTAEELASVRVLPIAERSGQKLYNLLLDQLTPTGRPADPAYLLAVALEIDKQQLVFREDETATRANLILNAVFRLSRAADGQVVYTGRSRSVSSYDILENPFAALVSEEDAFDRAARDLSDEIRTRLSVFLADPVAASP